MIRVSTSNAAAFLDKPLSEETVSRTAADLQARRGAGSEFTGWLDLPEEYDRDEFRKIKTAANKIRGESDVLIVIGVGGSYLGARAAIELLQSPNYNLLTKPTPNIYFVGNNLSGEHLREIQSLLRDKNFSINVVSKSGGTLEPAIAFRFFKTMLEQRYGDVGARNRIYATTDKRRGALRQMAKKEGFATFSIPSDIGGRFSILTAAGLLPMACAGIDIDKVMAGAYDAMHTYAEQNNMTNPAWQYAACREALYDQGKTVEILASYEPAFTFMAEWWKQLYGESCGKEGGGIFPASVTLTADLHSLGQYMQEGGRFLMETVISFDKFRRDIIVPAAEEDWDGLDYLMGRELATINDAARLGTNKAHNEGGVPLMEISMPAIDETAFGWLIYFFQYACALSGYIRGINPFDQPGVEAYKKNVFQLLQAK